jgi:hypothetical protein
MNVRATRFGRANPADAGGEKPTQTLAEIAVPLDSSITSWARGYPGAAGTLEFWESEILASWGPGRRSPGQVSRIPGSQTPPLARIDGGTLRNGIGHEQVPISAWVPASYLEPPLNVLHIRRRFGGASNTVPRCIAELACSHDVALRVRSPITSSNKMLGCALESPCLALT